MFTQKFEADFNAIMETEEPFALVRFHDGEHAILDGLSWSAASGWHVYGGQCWLKEDLKKALHPQLDRFGVGVSPPCCVPKATHFYRNNHGVSKSWLTFATIFSFNNYPKLDLLKKRFYNAAIVSSGHGDFKVPKDGVTKPWDIDGLVENLLKVDRPILIAAGPCANIIIHRYWQKQNPIKRQIVLDIGSVLDTQVHGHITRYYHKGQEHHKKHVCSWNEWVPYTKVGDKERELAEQQARNWASYERSRHDTLRPTTTSLGGQGVVRTARSKVNGLARPLSSRPKLQPMVIKTRTPVGGLPRKVSSGLAGGISVQKKRKGKSRNSGGVRVNNSSAVRVVETRPIPPPKVLNYTPKIDIYPPTDIRVVVLSYNRPQHLMRLLRDIQLWKGKHNVSLRVYDDASTLDYSEAVALIQKIGGNYVRAEKNHGKRDFWKWVGSIYKEQTDHVLNGTFFLLPDDVRLCKRFFDRALTIWSGIHDPSKVALNLLRDSGRDKGSCWTPITAQDVGSVLHQGWVDGAIMCNRAYFEALKWGVPAVPKSRWDRDPTLSSGVGQVLSKKLVELKKSIYGVKNSLLVHVGLPSTMNVEARKKNPLSAVAFIDGESAHTYLRNPETITVSLASIPRRQELLKRTIESLYWQCDKINVYLNGYKEVPDFLKRSRIEVTFSSKHGDRGDAGKFFWAEVVRGYHCTVDDDILYPPDYIPTLISKVEQYKRTKIVGVHGVVLPKEIGETYYGHRKVYRCLGSLPHDKPVHILGTGTVAYHTDTIKVSPKDFKAKNMADIWLGIIGKKQKGVSGMVCIAHAKGWLKDMPDPKPKQTIFEQQVNRDQRQVSELRKHGPWDPPKL